MVFLVLLSERSGLRCAWFYQPRAARSSEGDNSLPDFVAPPLCSSRAGSGVMSAEPRDVEDESAPGAFVGRICSAGEVVGITGEIQNLNY